MKRNVWLACASLRGSCASRGGLVLLMGLVILLSACGGGGGSTSTSRPAIDPDSILNGVALDGYLVGAKVCLDLNENWVCDAGEPSTETGPGGKFSLNISPRKYQDVYESLILAEVGPDVFDEAAGKTLRAQGQMGYTLGSHGGPAPVLSPINTLQTVLLFSSPSLTDRRVQSFQSAIYLSQVALSNTGEDYFNPAAPLSDADRNTAKLTGRVLAEALASIQARLNTQLPSIYGASSSGLGGRVANLLNQVLQDMPLSASTTLDEADIRSRIQQQINTLSFDESQEKLLLRHSRVASANEAVGILSNGLFDPSALGISRSFMQVKANGLGGSVLNKNWQYKNNAWAQSMDSPSDGEGGYHVFYRYYILTSPAKIADASIDIAGPTLTASGNQLFERFSAENQAPARNVQIFERDIGGLTYQSIPALQSMDGTFTSGQKAYQIQRKSMVEEYTLSGVVDFFNTLQGFMSSPRTCHAGLCWQFTQRADGNVQEGTIAFSTTSDAGSLNLGEGKYVDDWIAGTRILRITSIPRAVQNRSTFWFAKDGRFPIFADVDGKLWRGHYIPSGTYWVSDWLLDRNTLNDVLTKNQLNEMAL